MKIFWSWQSDTPGKTGRHFVRDALQEAIVQLKEAPDIEEPTAAESREALHLDQDMKGMPGSPSLAGTILAKIDNSAVVVADITSVGTATLDPKKKLINSNVALELGYAYRAVGEESVLLVFNRYYGSHEELPFDLRHRGGLIDFNLPPDASSELRRTEARKLTATFVERLRHYLSVPEASASTFMEVKTTFNRAVYFQPKEVLAEIGVPDLDLVQYRMDADAYCYLRLIPTRRRERPLGLAQLANAAKFAPTFGSQFGSIGAANRYGAIAYEPKTRPRSGTGWLSAVTQHFDNGELWSIGVNTIIPEKERGQLDRWVRLPMVHSVTFEQRYYLLVRQLSKHGLDQLDLRPPLHIEAGLVGIEGAFIGFPTGDFWEIKRPEVVHRVTVGNTEGATLDAFLLAFFDRVYDTTGYSRQSNLNGFPPNIPSAQERS